MSIIAQLGTDKNIQTTYGVSNKFSVPLFEEVDPMIKEQPEYCKNMAQVGFSQLMRNRNSLPVFAYDYIQVLRNYGTGNQPEDFYINKFRDTNQKNSNTTISDIDGDWTQSRESDREGLQNLDTKIVSVATNLKNAIHGIFSQYDEDLYVNCIDGDSAREEDMKMYGALFDSQMGDFTDMMEETYDIPLNPNPRLPKGVTPDEVLLYKEMGGFKSAYAIAAEEIVKYGFQVNDWEDTIKRKWIDDSIDLNLIIGRCKYDHEKDIEVVEYVDPANFTIQYSQENNFNDAEYCGYFTLEKISKLDVLGFPREKLLKAAKRWESYWSNPRDIDWEHIIYNDKVGNFKVPVFHYNWIDVDIKRNVKTTNKYGRTYIYEIPFDKELKPLTDYRKNQGVEQEEMNTRIRRTYECSWVVDTDMVYDYGRSKNQPRKNKRTPMLNFFVWRGITTNQELLFGSVTESIMPFYDNLQMSWLKYQDALMKSHPGGYAINIRLLQNLQIDGVDISPFQAFEMFWKTGKFPYLDVALGENYKGGDVLPIRKIEGNLGELISVISAEIHFNLQMIERFTGINPAPLGQTPDKDTPVSSTNMAVIGTNNVLRTFINGMYKVKERMGDCMLRRSQLQIRNNPDSAKAYEKIIGTFKVGLMKESDFLGIEYGLVPETRPDESEIRSIMETARAALTPGRDGNSQINIAQYAFIMEQVRGGGNIKKLTRDLAFLIRKNEQDIQRKQQENIRLQAEQQANMKREEAQAEANQNQQKLQGDIMLKKADTEKEILVDNNKAKNEAALKQMDANMQFKTMLYQVRNELLKNAERR